MPFLIRLQELPWTLQPFLKKFFLFPSTDWADKKGHFPPPSKWMSSVWYLSSLKGSLPLLPFFFLPRHDITWYDVTSSLSSLSSTLARFCPQISQNFLWQLGILACERQFVVWLRVSDVDLEHLSSKPHSAMETHMVSLGQFYFCSLTSVTGLLWR